MCTADISPVISCDSLSITGNNRTISIGSGITVGGLYSLDVSSTGLDLTIATGGFINGGYSGVKVNNNNIINTLINNGAISSSTYGILADGTINTLINKGTISGSNAFGIQVMNAQTINTLTNIGTISGNPSAAGIRNYGTIGTLNNLQGSGQALIIWRVLPTYYNIIISSSSNYGKLVSPTGFNAPLGATTFGISNISAGSSIVSGTPYTSVLSGIARANLVGGSTGLISGSSNNYTYVLRETALNSGIWDLTVSGYSGGSGGNTGQDSGGNSSAPANTNVASGTTISLSSTGVTANLILAGGTVTLSQGDRSAQSLTLVGTGSTITSSSMGAAELSGVISGSGSLTFNGTGMTVLSGANTYTGGTRVESGILSLLRGTLGTGEVYVSPGAQLRGTGSIAGAVIVSGVLKPGNSPGYLSTQSNVTMTSGSIYQQDIAGTTQANSATPIGTTGFYSFLSSGGQFVINAGATLTPALSNLFNAQEAGYGSTPYTPVLGDRFRIISADGGISGKFSSVTQPAGLTAGTQFLPFYNMAGSNSLDLAVIPTSYSNTISLVSGTKNAQSVGAALDKMVVASQAGVSNAKQDQLLYAGAAQTAATLPGYAQGLAGEVYPATVAVIAQTTQRAQQAVLARLGDTMGLSLPSVMTSPAGNTVLMGTTNAVLSGGVASSALSTNPSINPVTDAQSFTNGNVWGDLAYQKGNRGGDSYSGGWNSNLYQLVFGSDFHVSDGMRVGGGIALSSTTLNHTYGSATIQQGSVFAYGKMPVESFVLDAMVSLGLSNSDLSRGDSSGLSTGFKTKSVSGNDALVSVGVSHPIDMEGVRITPYARVTWQMVTQSSINEGSAASALSVNSFTGNGVRGVLGVAAGSKASDPMSEEYTYRVYAGIGADSSGVLNPTLNASIAGIGTNITTPNAGATFVQAGLFGTAKVSDNAYAFAGLSGEARSGQTLGVVNAGLRLQF